MAGLMEPRDHFDYEQDWGEVWRKGFAPVLCLRELHALRDGLAGNDPALIQSRTATPGNALAAEPSACCAVAYAGWKGLGLSSVDDVQRYFEARMANARNRVGGAAHSVKFFALLGFDAPR